MERKSLFGWRRLGYTLNMGYGSICQSYTSNDKKELLNEVLEKHYMIDKRFVEVVEYPMIKVY
jgi:hypothetical protein